MVDRQYKYAKAYADLAVEQGCYDWPNSIDLADRMIALADAEHADLLAQIKRVRALHRVSNDGSFCVGCWEAGGYDGAPSYPCSTIIALDGEN
jgi:hypothetical protein